MNDTIAIRDLEVRCRVGVPDAERAQPQRLLLNVEMFLDFSGAAGADDLSQTIDYAAVAQRLLHFGHGRSWKLIETLAVDIAQLLLREFTPARVAVEVQKFILPETRCVAVRVVRTRTA